MEIHGGTVFDGIAPPRVANVRIEDGRVSEVDAPGRSARRIDATGLLVMPGFIDIHSHSDFTVAGKPTAEAKLLQGVTTDVTGNCSFSPFPLRDDDTGRRHGAFFEKGDQERWPGVEAFRETMRSRRLGFNVAPLVGLGAIRLNVIGEDDRPPTARELEAMQDLLGRQLADGAFGASSGLVYTPSAYARPEELIELARVVASYGGTYATHMRNEGARVEEAVEEALTVAGEAGCSLQISHHKVFGRAHWGAVNRTLSRVDAAAASGLDVALDVYPYTYGNSILASILPASARDGGERELKRRLERPDDRERILAHLASQTDVEVAEIILAEVPSEPALVGKTIGEAAAARRNGAGPAEELLDLVLRDGTDVTVLIPGMDEKDVRTILTHERSMFGSDGWIMNREGINSAHPRNFAGAVRLLSHYVRDEHVLGLHEAVRKLTYAPAERLGMHDRGRITPGAAADITILDLERLEEGSTIEEPCRYPKGITHVLVNGALAVEDGVVTGERAGEVLTHRKTS